MESNLKQLLIENDADGIVAELIHCLILSNTCPRLTPRMKERIDTAILMVSAAFPIEAGRALSDALAHHQILNTIGDN
tara:strand:- start:5111 stop:5344 length:234 start_codon:yes stop_codon:yes gene_type:complete